MECSNFEFKIFYKNICNFDFTDVILSRCLDHKCSNFANGVILNKNGADVITALNFDDVFVKLLHSISLVFEFKILIFELKTSVL